MEYELRVVVEKVFEFISIKSSAAKGKTNPALCRAQQRSRTRSAAAYLLGLNIAKLSYGATCALSYPENSSSNALASCRSAVSNPSANQL